MQANELSRELTGASDEVQRLTRDNRRLERCVLRVPLALLALLVLLAFLLALLALLLAE